MNQKEKIVLYLLGIGVLILLLNNFLFSGRNLRDAIQKLEDAQKSINSSVKMIESSKAKIDSMQMDIQNFKSYIVDIQGRVEILDLEKRVNEQKFAVKRDSIRDRLKTLYKEVELVGEELPEIPVVSIHSNN